MNYKITVQVVQAKLETVNLGGFIYYVNRCNIGNIIDIKVLTNAMKPINSGDWISTSHWVIARTDKDDTSPEDPAILVENYTIIEDEKEKVLDQYFKGKLSGTLIVTAKSRLTKVGIMKKPFIRCSLRFRDYGMPYIDGKPNSFCILAVAFYSNAKKISEVIGTTPQVVVEVCFKKKLYEPGIELCINSLTVADNGNDDDKEKGGED